MAKYLFLNGTPERIRTSDLRYRKPPLYPAELRALSSDYTSRLAAFIKTDYVSYLAIQALIELFDHL